MNTIILSKQKVLENLKDAGYNQGIINKFMHSYYQENIKEQLQILLQHRTKQLNQIHRLRKRLDSLDFLIYELKKHFREKGLK